jgi:trehalose 6-phosphate phosphatase
LLLLTDFDGTLTPLVEDPAEAKLGPEVRRSLRSLAHSSRVRVAVLSGRALHDLRRRVCVTGVICAGCHGLEIVGPGLAFTHPEAAAQRAALRAVARELRARTASIPGVRVEPKGLAVAVHYQAAPPHASDRAEGEVARVLNGSGDAFARLRGKNVVEILPRVGWHKGTCAHWLADRLAPALAAPVALLALGDDATDERAFAALARRAVTVRVGTGRGRTHARHRLRDTTEVGRLLAALAAAARIPMRGRA